MSECEYKEIIRLEKMIESLVKLISEANIIKPPQYKLSESESIIILIAENARLREAGEVLYKTLQSIDEAWFKPEFLREYQESHLAILKVLRAWESARGEKKQDKGAEG